MTSRLEKMLMRTMLAVSIEIALCSAAVAQEAVAQEKQAPVPASAEPEAAKPKPDADAAYTELDAVVVTGAQAALIRSRDLKQNALIVQDSISAIELGKFPDNNVADSLAHVTGVTISRTKGGEGQYVSVRGLGPSYNLVTLNNRILATDGDGREFAFDVLPSEVISGADVLKSAQASQIEGAIGGLVSLRSARPFDNPGFHSGIRVEGDHNDMSGKNGYKVSGVYSDTFANNTVGILLGAVYSDRELRTDSMSYNSYNPDAPGSFDANEDGNITPDEEDLLASCCIAFGSVFEKKKRSAISGVLQWRPSDNFMMALDVIATRLDSPRVGYNEAYYVEYAPERWSDVVIKDHLVTSMTVHDLIPEIANITEYRVVDTTQIGWNGEWNLSDSFLLTGDVYRSTSKRNAGGQDSFVVAGIAGDNTGYWSVNNNGLPSIRVTLEDGRDLATELNNHTLGNGDYGPHYAGLSGVNIDDVVTGASLEGKLTVNSGHLDDLVFGLVDTVRQKTRDTIDNDKSGGSCQYCDLYSTTFASLGADVVHPLTLSNFMHQAGGDFPTSMVYFDVPAYFKALESLNGQINPATGEVFDSALSLPVFVPTDSYDVTEKTFAVYGEAHFSGDKWVGNFGLRWLRTKTNSKSAIDRIISIYDPTPDVPTSSPIVTYSPAEPVDVDGSYNKLLPSANFTYSFTPTLLARFAAAKTMARPSLDQLAPTTTDETLDRTFSITIAGDPGLKPVDATQEDFSLEWYPGSKSMLSMALFAKQLKNFITYQTDEHVDIGVPGYLYTVTRPINGDTADVYGVEIAGQTFFDNGFGVRAQFTKTNTRAYVDGDYTGQLEGVAPTASSLALLYEGHDISAQIAWDYTSEFTETSDAVAGLPSVVDSVLWLTASASYAFTKDVSIFVEGSNLTDAIYRSNLGRPDASYGFESWGRTVSLGITITF